MKYFKFKNISEHGNKILLRNDKGFRLFGLDGIEITMSDQYLQSIGDAGCDGLQEITKEEAQNLLNPGVDIQKLSEQEIELPF